MIIIYGRSHPKATYQKDEMMEKRKQALEAWSEKIAMLVSNDNVVMLRWVINIIETIPR